MGSQSLGISLRRVVECLGGIWQLRASLCQGLAGSHRFREHATNMSRELHF